jgi:predicted RNA binding protein YcfA (HicA-like mRNA interferase family)
VSSDLPAVSGKQVIKALEQRGWYVKRIKGSHHALRHPTPSSFVRIAGDPSTAKLLLLWRRDDDREVLRLFLDTAREVAASRRLPEVLRGA